MDRNNEDQKNGQWVDDQMASLNADANWSPNSSQAFERVKGFRGQPPNSGGRMWMAVAVSAAIGLVLFSLPWRQLRSVIKPSASSQSVPQAQTSESTRPSQVQTVAAPQQELPVTESFSKPLLAKPLAEAAASATLRAVELPAAPPAPESTALPALVQDEPKPKKSTVFATPPRVIKTVEPVYTDEARVAHVQGTVTLDVTVHKDGTVTVTKVFQGLGYGLDEAAILAVVKFQFEPGTFNGQAVDTQSRIDVNFRLF